MPILLWLVQSAWAIEGNFIPRETSIFDRAISFVGIFFLIGLAWLLSEKRRRVDWRMVGIAVSLQLIFGLIVLSPFLADALLLLNDFVDKLLGFSNEGAKFVFGTIVPHQIDVLGDAGPVPTTFIGDVSPPLKTFAFWILPTIIFFSTMMSILYYLGVMQVIVRGIAWAMVRTMGTSGAETLSAAGNIFVGQTEAPLLIRPFLDKMTRSELMAVMTGGFATVAGGVLGAYVGFLRPSIPDIASHLIVASVMSAPAAFAVAKVMVPETEVPVTRGQVAVEFPQTASNVIEAGANGASDGMKLVLNVAAMLIAAVAVVALVNWGISFFPVTFCPGGVAAGYTCAGDVAGQPLSLQVILGWLFAPIAFFMGVPWGEATVVGRLLGEKLVLTEFVAYINLAGIMTGEEAVISRRSAIITSYALCGFANFASIGIQLGGIGGIAPSRTGDLASLGLKAMIGGALATCMTGAVVGLFV